jgi:transketolase N-terminal domain/subunit
MLTDRELKLKSNEYRRTILRIIKQARAGHTGGDLSSSGTPHGTCPASSRTPARWTRAPTEASLAASHYHLDNLTVIVDSNGCRAHVQGARALHRAMPET